MIGARDAKPQLTSADWMRALLQSTPGQSIASCIRCWRKFPLPAHRFIANCRAGARASPILIFPWFTAWCFCTQPGSVQDPEVLLRLFHFIAEHGLKLSTTTEQRIEQVLPFHGGHASTWSRALDLPPGNSFSAARGRCICANMHALRYLTLVFPELKAIDALVVRDFYHRFTVDEHSFAAIESLHRLQAIIIRVGPALCGTSHRTRTARAAVPFVAAS